MCFFFSSRRRHTRFSRDWSSDVCSSDLTNFEKQDMPSILVNFKINDMIKTPTFIAAFFLTFIFCQPDRKSTRLNSSHVKISYAVFCLKKKKKETYKINNINNHIIY